MNWYELRALRDQYPPNDYMQGLLANKEHAAYASMLVDENPWNAISLLFAVPGYYAAKKTGLMQGRSNPTIDQIFSGYSGIGEGLKKWKGRQKPVGLLAP